MYNPFSLKNKIILVTGASSGIGKAIAVESSKMGARLIITGRDKIRLDETFNLLEGGGHQMHIGDLKNETDIDKLIEVLPKIDGCVNNAGVGNPLLIQFINQKVLGDTLDINTIAPILITQKIVKQKKIEKEGSIVFISSVSGVFCSSIGGGLYSMSKGAINGFAKGAALDLASKKIRVNTVCPGMVDTNIFSEGTLSEEQLEIDKKRYPLGRYGKPEEVAHAVIYLLSDASKWVTGSNLLIDGGYTLL